MASVPPSEAVLSSADSVPLSERWACPESAVSARPWEPPSAPLADSYRALKRRTEVEDLWEELRESSPSADLVTEGRIVMAGSLADRGKFSEAIALLEKSQRSVKRAEIHHLRQAYALADLYERAGDVARARELFRWVLTYEPDFADAAERASSLA